MNLASKTRVLFVDDEPLVLSGLQRMLRRLSNEWDMKFVNSGQAALEAMRSSPFNVVISDMRMPGMNGADLLATIARSYPKTIRLILSGHADKNLIVQCVGTAHQFLAKPCEPDELKAAVIRARDFGNSVKSEVLKELIVKMETLPSVPTLFHQIVKKLQDENSSLEDVAEIIASDVAMIAKLLKLVNSAFFGLRRPVNNPLDAINYLGLDMIKALVLAVNAFSCFEEKDIGPVSLDTLWSHSLQVANWSRNIARAEEMSPTQVDECFIAGMLHDVGKLALSANLPDRYRQALRLAVSEGIPIHCAEEKVLGADHADVGGYLLRLWGLSGNVVDAIAFHHAPASSPVEDLAPLGVVHAADALASHIEPPALGQPALLDHSYFERIGLTEKLSAWKELQP